jgi:hypothetical protein
MGSTSLNHTSPNALQSRRRWPLRIMGIGIAALLLAAAMWQIDIRQDESRMDAVTGSTTSKTVWLMGITSGPRMDISPLERRLRASGIAWTPSWRFLHNTHRNIYGGATCYECASAPAIYQLRPVLTEFAASSTDAELREFVRIMQSGTEAERTAVVDAAAEKGFQMLSTRPAGR